MAIDNIIIELEKNIDLIKELFEIVEDYKNSRDYTHYDGVDNKQLFDLKLIDIDYEYLIDDEYNPVCLTELGKNVKKQIILNLNDKPELVKILFEMMYWSSNTWSYSAGITETKSSKMKYLKYIGLIENYNKLTPSGFVFVYQYQTNFFNNNINKSLFFDDNVDILTYFDKNIIYERLGLVFNCEVEFGSEWDYYSNNDFVTLITKDGIPIYKHYLC